MGGDDGDVSFKRILPPVRRTSIDSGNDFTLIGDVESNTSEQLSHQLRVSIRN
jgi:hypothetical protein